jgi:hypothetical protein|nr:MAG TPA: hypothetical protein [Caudoviricetes sp.]
MKTVLEFTRDLLLEKLENKKYSDLPANNVNKILINLLSREFRNASLEIDNIESFVKSNIDEIDEFIENILDESLVNSSRYNFKYTDVNDYDETLFNLILEMAEYLIVESLLGTYSIDNLYSIKFSENEKNTVYSKIKDFLKKDKRKVLNLEDEY